MPGQELSLRTQLTSRSDMERRTIQVQDLLEIFHPGNWPPSYGFDIQDQEERINLRHELAFLRQQMGDGSPPRNA
jgi:hypothetical protein